MSIFHLLKILFLDDFYSFLDFWYYHLPKKIFQKVIDFIYFLDADIGIKSHFRNIFKPFYGEKFFILLLISLPFRILIIVIGTIFYSFFMFTAIFLIIIVITLPIFLFLIFINVIDYGILLRK